MYGIVTKRNTTRALVVCAAKPESASILTILKAMVLMTLCPHVNPPTATPNVLKSARMNIVEESGRPATA